MKLTKSDLKKVVKECLMELLQEGIGSVAQRGRDDRQLTPPQRAPLSLQQSIAQKSQPIPPSVRETIKREAGGNKIMESIFADTAKTTLPAQLRSEGSRTSAPAGTAESIVENHAPEDIFGDEVASKWATLAFSDSPKK